MSTASTVTMPVLHALSGSHSQPESDHSSSGHPPNGPVQATMNFYRGNEAGEKPFNYVEAPPAGVPQRNFSDNPNTILVQDARGRESELGENLDKHAFALLQNIVGDTNIDWDDDESVKSQYYPEVKRLLLERSPGKASKVVIFDHTVRRQKPQAHRAPVTRAHIDQTGKSARARVQLHLSEQEAHEVLDKGVRYRIINVWRPLNGAVESFPLAFADSSTVKDEDIVPVEHRYPTRTGETAAVQYKEGQSWYYWSGIDNDERILLQCFDSLHPENRVPHSAFEDPRSTLESKPRESIEVRALVFG